ncbi:MAG: ATP-dependent RecD-like DNA helicase [Myxococcales bacterium]|nr:ATP-dependent RecD-like DNA helicase [Myxococcales bacterium]MCB9735718.1 ATP-dependent RecD-like DNA helicase [Deltaproteobacteria bacterium]
MSISLEGTVEHIRFHNDETFWTVAGVRVAGEPGAVPVVGSLPGIQAGMSVRMSGRWEANPRYGRQFKAETYTELVPATRQGLVGYLASGFITGIGPKMAERIVDHFGTDAVDVVMRAPSRLAEVPGLGKKRVQALVESFKERRGAQEALVFLFGLGIPRGLAMRIYRKYRDDAVMVVRQRPYQLAEEVYGIGFHKADQVARGLSIAQDDPGRLRAGIFHCLREARDEGHCFLPRELLLDQATALLGVGRELLPDALSALVYDGKVTLSAAPFAGEDEVAYLTPLYHAELRAAAHLAALLATVHPRDEDLAARVLSAAELLGIALAPGQEAAVRAALDNGVTIVTGGPGTGKTTIIRTLLEAAGVPKQRVALAAPTGRAAKRMSEATGEPAYTIHRLLEYSQELGFQRDESNPLEADLVIIDEASMVDLPLFASLLRAVPATARVVLVGDQDQLPPVGPGSPLMDLIACGRVPVARLSEIFRQGAGSAIIENAHAVNRGEPPLPTPAGTPLQDFYFVRRDEPEAIAQTIEELVTRRIPERFGFDPVRDVQVLSPMRTGQIGVERLNERLQAILNPPREGEPDTAELVGFRVGDKVMQTQNDYDRGVFNGDIGVVSHVDAKKGVIGVAIDDREVLCDREQRDALVLAYAITVHKSQGSEYPAVVMPVSTHHFKMLRRNLLYTGITRGKRLVVLVGTERAARIAVGNGGTEIRFTMLDRRLQQVLDGELFSA